MRRKFNRHKRNEKLRRRWNRQLKRVTRHLEECEAQIANRIIVITGRFDENGHQLMRCLHCGLVYAFIGKTKEIEVRGLGRLPEEPTVLDLLALSRPF